MERPANESVVLVRSFLTDLGGHKGDEMKLVKMEVTTKMLSDMAGKIVTMATTSTVVAGVAWAVWPTIITTFEVPPLDFLQILGMVFLGQVTFRTFRGW